MKCAPEGVNSKEFIHKKEFLMITENTRMKFVGVTVCAAAVLLTACATATPEQKGAGTGALIGAVAGQVLGRDAKSSAIGAGFANSVKSGVV